MPPKAPLPFTSLQPWVILIISYLNSDICPPFIHGHSAVLMTVPVSVNATLGPQSSKPEGWVGRLAGADNAFFCSTKFQNKSVRLLQLPLPTFPSAFSSALGLRVGEYLITGIQGREPIWHFAGRYISIAIQWGEDTWKGAIAVLVLFGQGWKEVHTGKVLGWNQVGKDPEGKSTGIMVSWGKANGTEGSDKLHRVRGHGRKAFLAEGSWGGFLLARTWPICPSGLLSWPKGWTLWS